MSKRYARVGIGASIDDLKADLAGNNEALTRRVTARLLKLKRISAHDQVRIVDYILYRLPPSHVRLRHEDGEQVWLLVHFEVVRA
jgi:hypothetical protein